MAISDFNTDAEVAAAVGTSIARLRLKKMRTQSDVASKAGISVLALRRLERGQNTTLLTLLSVLRELGALPQLAAAFPAREEPSPMELLERVTPERKRARRRTVR